MLTPLGNTTVHVMVFQRVIRGMCESVQWGESGTSDLADLTLTLWVLTHISGLLGAFFIRIN